jgi:hypothetical protein
VEPQDGGHRLMNPRTWDEDIHKEWLTTTCTVLDIGGDVVVGNGTVFVLRGERKEQSEEKDRIAYGAQRVQRPWSCLGRAGRGADVPRAVKIALGFLNRVPFGAEPVFDGSVVQREVRNVLAWPRSGRARVCIR